MFSVLFALLINKIAEDAQTNSYKANALEQIRAELEGNQTVLEDWMAAHSAIVNNLGRLIEGPVDSLQLLVARGDYVPMHVIFHEQSLIEQPLANSAWHSAQSAGILSEFEFETLQQISQTYELQAYIMETSIDRIVEVYFSKSTDVDKARELLVELRLRFRNLQGQEYTLRGSYEKTLGLLNRE